MKTEDKNIYCKNCNTICIDADQERITDTYFYQKRGMHGALIERALCGKCVMSHKDKMYKNGFEFSGVSFKDGI